MYAIVVTGGKQYKVSKDDIISVEKVDLEAGEKINLEVLMISDEGKVITGAPISGASVEAEVLRSGRSKKMNIFKYKPKIHVRKHQGHRQAYSILKILSINC